MIFRALTSGLLSLLLCACLAVSAHGVLLSDLINNAGTITCDDKIFSDFTYTFSGDVPAATGVNVSCIFDSQGNPGLRFQGAFIDLPGGGGSDALITFKVSVLPTSPLLINDVHLAFNGAVSGPSGFAGVTETFLPLPSPILNVFNLQPGSFKLTDFAFLPTPVTMLNVQKDILLFAGANSAATISFIDQTFSQIPEPTSWIVLAGLGLCFVNRRIRSL